MPFGFGFLPKGRKAPSSFDLAETDVANVLLTGYTAQKTGATGTPSKVKGKPTTAPDLKLQFEIAFGTIAGTAAAGLVASGVPTTGFPSSGQKSVLYRNDGTIWKDGVQVASGLATWASNAVIVVDFNVTTGDIWFNVNGTQQGAPAAGTGAATQASAGTYGPAAYLYTIGDTATFRLKAAQFQYPLVSGFMPWVSSSGDVYWTSVGFLSGFEGTNNQTTFTDEAKGRAITRGETAKIQTTAKKFGASALGGIGPNNSMAGTADYLQLASNADYVFGAGDFTAECWAQSGINLASNLYSCCLLSVFETFLNKRSWQIWYNHSTQQIEGHVSLDGTTPITVGIGLTGASFLASFHHVALQRNGAALQLFLDGVKASSDGALSTTALFNDGTVPLMIGANRSNAAAGGRFAGYLDEVRITKGVARYPSGGFTPPIAAFPRAA